MSAKPSNPRTVAVHAGRDPRSQFGMINPPVWHASTVLFPTLDALDQAIRQPYEGLVYGLLGTPTSRALEQAVAAMEHADRAIAVGSGLAAIAVAIMPFVQAGDHLLVSDGAYGPTRHLCEHWFRRWDIETSYYDPMIGAGIADLIRPNTRLVHLETPSSLTFEVPDVRAIVGAAKVRGLKTVIDNTWASPIFFQPMDLGVDAVILAGTKYIAGHSDVVIGFVATTEESWLPVKRAAAEFGHHATPDDCYLTLRGLRTAAVRLKQHEASALEVARWLQSRPEVRRVLHPALPDHPGHLFWKRDFTGSSGLFAIELQPCSRAAVAAMVENMALFGIGFSWGGFESLILPFEPNGLQRVSTMTHDGPLIRLHIGLEEVSDLVADLERGFDRLRHVAG
ncbi:MAG: cystathionine beta-lyase [Rhodospirillales bacterium]|nr:cystathionine beta-lyase [Rhodospirillales bacterium]